MRVDVGHASQDEIVCETHFHDTLLQGVFLLPFLLEKQFYYWFTFNLKSVVLTMVVQKVL